MAVDASIALQAKLPQFDNPLTQYAQVSQIKHSQQQNQLADMMMAKEQRSIDSENALSGAYRDSMGADGTMDRNKLYQSLAQGGQGRQLPAIQKGFAEQDKSGMEASKAKIEAGLQKIGAAAQIMSGVKDQATYDQARQQIAQIMGPEAAANIPPVYDPAAIEQGRIKAMSLKDQMEQHWKEIDFKYKQGNDQANRNVTLAGQDKSAASAAVGHRLKSEENGIVRDGIVGKRTQDVEMKLQDDYRAESKGWSETSTSMKKILGAISTADKNPGSALAAGTAFMKILDPGSVVRESELGMALNASGWFDRATNVAKTMQVGKVMTATQQKNLRDASENLFEEAKAAQREVDSAYRKRATDYGASPDRVIVDRGQNKPRVPVAPVKPAATPTGSYSDAEKERRYQEYKDRQK